MEWTLPGPGHQPAELAVKRHRVLELSASAHSTVGKTWQTRSMKAPTKVFRERLLPSVWVYVVVLSLVAMLAIAVGAAYSPGAGWLTFTLLAIFCAFALFIGSPVITVSAHDLRAGRATIPRSQLGSVEVLAGPQMRGAQNVATRYLLLRPWRTRGGVLIELIDEQDPHPAWVLTTKDPTRLAVALRRGGTID